MEYVYLFIYLVFALAAIFVPEKLVWSRLYAQKNPELASVPEKYMINFYRFLGIGLLIALAFYFTQAIPIV
ncbi:MAG: hypothetical protein KBB86_00585 [Candidatus Pacebacteria bacterium]|nr:hypothetical protein [Candidatus Paceibacterota bacterium]